MIAALLSASIGISVIALALSGWSLFLRHEACTRAARAAIEAAAQRAERHLSLARAHDRVCGIGMPGNPHIEDLVKSIAASIRQLDSSMGRKNGGNVPRWRAKDEGSHA